mmetsp:Transcript_104789/g.301265  ORF Transcript_104789/g.301265 Transcript_104789/m.301265 type:complete len:228 (-) Transcript_104789:46-729(-)
MHLSTALAFALFAAHDGSVHSCGSLNARRAQTTHLQAPALGDTAHPGAFQCNRWSQPPRPQRREHCSEASALPRPHPRCWWHRRAPRETRQTAGDLGAFLRSMPESTNRLGRACLTLGRARSCEHASAPHLPHAPVQVPILLVDAVVANLGQHVVHRSGPWGAQRRRRPRARRGLAPQPLAELCAFADRHRRHGGPRHEDATGTGHAFGHGCCEHVGSGEAHRRPSE